MSDALAPIEPMTAADQLNTAQTNPAVARCIDAWQQTYRLALKRKKSDHLAREDAELAYRMAMPPLVGYDNICNFIACIGYGMLTEVIAGGYATRLLYAAQVALSTIAPQSKTKGREPVPTVPLVTNP